MPGKLQRESGAQHPASGRGFEGGVHGAVTQKQALPADASITGKVGIGQIPGGFGLEVELQISLPGLDRDLAQQLVDAAHLVCPYSNATRGNIDVRLVLI